MQPGLKNAWFLIGAQSEGDFWNHKGRTESGDLSSRGRHVHSAQLRGVTKHAHLHLVICLITVSTAAGLIVTRRNPRQSGAFIVLMSLGYRSNIWRGFLRGKLSWRPPSILVQQPPSPPTHPPTQPQAHRHWRDPSLWMKQTLWLDSGRRRVGLGLASARLVARKKSPHTATWNANEKTIWQRFLSPVACTDWPSARALEIAALGPNMKQAWNKPGLLSEGQAERQKLKVHSPHSGQRHVFWSHELFTSTSSSESLEIHVNCSSQLSEGINLSITHAALVFSRWDNFNYFCANTSFCAWLRWNIADLRSLYFSIFHPSTEEKTLAQDRHASSNYQFGLSIRRMYACVFTTLISQIKLPFPHFCLSGFINYYRSGGEQILSGCSVSLVAKSRN